MLKTKAIKAGDTLGIIALASPVAEPVFKAGLEYLKSLGFKTKVALSPFGNTDRKSHLFSSAAAKERAAAIQTFFEDDEVSAIVSVRGGYGTIELLPFLDLEVFKKNPKLVIGLSDVSTLLCYLSQHADLVTLHAPSLITYGAKSATNPEALDSVNTLIKFIAGKIQNPFQNMEFTALTGATEGEGRLVGGNLTVLASLIGTKWEPDFTDRILFLEDIGEKPFRLHRSLMQMKIAGKFEKLKGVLLGSFNDCNIQGKPAATTVEDVVRSIFSEYKYPVLSGLPFGHEDRSLPLPLGIKARIFQNKLEITEKTVLD